MPNFPLIYPVILSGGAGTRLWPVSRRLKPKQFHPIVSDRTLFGETLSRVDDPRFAAPTIICNEDHRFLVAEEFRLAGKKPHSIVLEPAARNTAPAIGAAAFLLSKIDPEMVIAVLPSDHVIANPSAFHAAVDCATKAAQNGHLTTFGISPDRPEAGYGYIQAGPAIADLPGVSVISRFVEKPDIKTAQEYLNDGSYYWNSGMFLFRASDFLKELQAHAPDVWLQSQKAAEQASEDGEFLRLDSTSFKAAPAISVDYAVMEKTRDAVVVPSDFGWSDVGSWRSLHEIGTKDQNGNVTLGDVALHGATNSYVRSDTQLVTAIGIQDMVVVATDDAILIAPTTHDQDVRFAVEALIHQGRSEAVAHSEVFRPWGSYQNLYVSDNVLVKQIVVNPDAKLSLQYHNHRTEHWTVVDGTARVTTDGKVFDLSVDQSTYIPLKSVHRVENIGTVPLRLIEVQIGEVISEDDIVRIEDDFGRV